MLIASHHAATDEQTSVTTDSAAWNELTAYLQGKRPANIDGIKDATVFSYVVRYYEAVVNDPACPKLTYYALSAKESAAAISIRGCRDGRSIGA